MIEKLVRYIEEHGCQVAVLFSRLILYQDYGERRWSRVWWISQEDLTSASFSYFQYLADEYIREILEAVSREKGVHAA